MARRIRALERKIAAASAPELMRIHGNLRLSTIVLTAQDVCFIQLAMPPRPLLGPDGISTWRLVDLAALMYAFSRSAALLGQIAGTDRVADEFSREFVEVARISASRSYQRAWNPDSGGRLTRIEKAWLKLLTIDLALREMEAAPTRGALAVAVHTLRA
jgi:predicted trehalose synthase